MLRIPPPRVAPRFSKARAQTLSMSRKSVVHDDDHWAAGARSCGIDAPARDHGVVPGVIERAEEGRYSTNSVANQVSSSAATFLAEPEVWRAMSSM